MESCRFSLLVVGLEELILSFGAVASPDDDELDTAVLYLLKVNGSLSF